MTAWLAGKNLHEWSLEIDDPLRRLDVLAECAKALDAFHRQTGHIHRDLKPSNIIVAATDDARIIDFGLVRDTSVPRNSSVVMGSPGHLAPEILLGAPYSEDTDRFAFAGVLYHQLVGSSPPDQARVGNQVAAICAAVYNAGFAGAASLLGSLLQPDPTRRLRTEGTADMLEQVARVVARSSRGAEFVAPTHDGAPRKPPAPREAPGLLAPAGPDLTPAGLDDVAAAIAIRTWRALVAATVAFAVVLALFAVLHAR